MAFLDPLAPMPQIGRKAISGDTRSVGIASLRSQ
jgi:hypothetical protein